MTAQKADEVTDPDHELAESGGGRKFLSGGEEAHEVAEAVRGEFPVGFGTSARFGRLPRVAYGSTQEYATAFLTQLLNVNYGVDSYDEAMEWAGWELAQVGVPESWTGVDDDDLRVIQLMKLIRPTDSPTGSSTDGSGGSGGSGVQLSLVPRRAEWQHLAEAGVVQRVRNVLVLPDPRFEQLRSQLVPASGDPRTDCVRVAATIDRTSGITTQSQNVDIPTFCVGTAAHHAGLGFQGVGAIQVAP